MGEIVSAAVRRTTFRLVAAGLLAGGMSGCTAALVSSDEPYPVYGNPVNPTPVPSYGVQCDTRVGVEFLLLNTTRSGCTQVIRPPEPIVSVRG